MKGFKASTLVVVVLAAGAIGYLAMRKGGNADSAKSEMIKGFLPEAQQSEWQKHKDNPILFLNEKEEDRKKKFVPAPYDEIEIVRGARTVSLKREGEDEWKMTAPVASEVESHVAKQMVELFATDTALTPAKKVTDKALLGDFGLDEAHAIKVTLKEKGIATVEVLIGDRKKLESGDEQGGGMEQYDTFVMLTKAPEDVYRAKQKDLRTPFEKEAAEVRSKKVFTYDLTDIAKVTIEDPANKDAPKIVLSAAWEAPTAEEPKKDEPPKDEKAKKTEEKRKKNEDAKGAWTMTEPKVDGFTLAEQRQLWTNIANFRATEFVMGKAPGPETGLADPAKAGKVTFELTKAGEKPITILLGDVKEKDRSVYAMIAGKDEYLVISDSTKKTLLKSLSDLREKKVLAIEKEEQVSRIEVTNQHTTAGPMVFAKSATGWTMEAPAPMRVSEKEVGYLVSALKSFQATEFLAAAPKPEESGLDKPQIVVTVTVDGQPKTLRMGAEKDSKITCTVDGTNLYFTTSTWSKSKFDKKAEDFKDKVVVDLKSDDIAKLTLAHDGETVEVEHAPDGKWAVTAPEALTSEQVKETEVNAIANTLKGLEIKEFTDKKPADVGLDKPAFTLTVTLKDGATRVIRVSDQLKDSDSYIAVTAPGVEPAMVFTLDQFKIKNLRKKLADLKK